MSNQIIDNIELVMQKHGSKIHSNKQLLLLYWKEIDQVRMNKNYISTEDFLNNATEADLIINGKMMYDILCSSN